MKVTPQELFEVGAHIGHQRRRWNPKTRPYIFDHRNGITIIDLVKTCKQIEDACEVAKNVVSGGGDIWFVGTKKQAKDVMKEGATAVDMPFCVNRWLGGTLTNFQTVERSLNKYKKFLRLEESGDLAKMHKKEAAAIKREMNRMHSNFEGLMKVEELPGALFVIDVLQEHIAVAEARKIGIPVMAVVDTEMIPFFILLTQAVGTVADHRPGNAEAFHGLGMPEVLAGQKSGLFFQRHLSNQITNVLYIHMSPLFVHASCNRSTVLRSQGSWILGTSEISRFVYGASGSSMTLSGFPLSTNLPCSIIYTESEM